MIHSYLGTLDRRDPLYEILIDKVCPHVHDPRFHARRLSPSNVYHYTEESSWIAIADIKEQLAASREAFPDVDAADIFKTILQEHGPEPTDESVVTAATLFRAPTIRRFGVFPGVMETLSSLGEHYRLELVSDAQWVFTEPEIAMTGLDPFFPVKGLSSRFRCRKPDPRLFDKRLRKLGIGDNPARYLTGSKNAGLRFILFRGECRDYNGLTSDRCFQNYSELQPLIKER